MSNNKTAMMQLIEQLEDALTQPFVNKETAMDIKMMAENLLLLEEKQHLHSFIDGFT